MVPTPEPGDSRTFGYCSVSPRWSRSDLSRRKQQTVQEEMQAELNADWNTIAVYYREHGLPQFSRFITDMAVEWRKPFLKRAQGEQLLRLLRRGDHLVIAKAGSAFRNAREVTKTLHYLASKGIVVHVIDMRLNSQTEAGQAVTQAVLAVQKMQKRHLSLQRKATVAELKNQGKYCGGNRGYGFKLGEHGPVPDYAEIKVIDEIIRLRNGWGTEGYRKIGFPQIANMLNS